MTSFLCVIPHGLIGQYTTHSYGNMQRFLCRLENTLLLFLIICVNLKPWPYRENVIEAISSSFVITIALSYCTKKLSSTSAVLLAILQTTLDQKMYLYGFRFKVKKRELYIYTSIYVAKTLWSIYKYIQLLND